MRLASVRCLSFQCLLLESSPRGVSVLPASQETHRYWMRSLGFASHKILGYKMLQVAWVIVLIDCSSPYVSLHAGETSGDLVCSVMYLTDAPCHLFPQKAYRFA